MYKTKIRVPKTEIWVSRLGSASWRPGFRSQGLGSRSLYLIGRNMGFRGQNRILVSKAEIWTILLGSETLGQDFGQNGSWRRQSLWDEEGGTYLRTERFPPVLQDFTPFRTAAQKLLCSITRLFSFMRFFRFNPLLLFVLFGFSFRERLL